MAKDPVCGMDVDPKTTAGKSSTKDKPIISVPSDVRLPLIRILKNTYLLTTNTKLTITNKIGKAT